MARLTKYDEVRQVYVIKPDAPQGQIIQRLGRFEDMCDSHEADDDSVCPYCGREVVDDA